jgi:hypothetical protein
VRRFRYVDETIALVLAFVGIKILAADVVQISDLASLAVVAALLAGGIVASLVADRLAPPSSDRGSDATPASLPRGAQYSGIFRAAPDLDQGRASDEDVINSRPRPRRGDGVTHSRTPSSSSDCRSSAGSR